MSDRLALLERAQQGDGSAEAQLLTENSGLIWSIVKRYYGCGVETDDLYQLGCIGFIKAVKGFDLNYGTQFSTYAVPKISGEIRRFLRDDGAVKVSRGIKEQAQAIRTARASLEQQFGREPTISEISEETGIDPTDIATAETAVGPTESLQRETGDEGFTLEHVLGDFGQEERLIERVALRETIARLPEREQKVIALRFFHSMTQDKAAKVMGVSQVQISRLEKRAVESLRKMLV